MEKDFDFSNIGKRMPYTVPDGFFENLEEKIARQTKPRRRNVLLITLSSIAAAACVASAIMISGIFENQKAGNIESVDLAFTQLSNQDQEFLLSIYSEDVFINNDVSY